MLKRFNELVTKLQSTNGRLEKEAYLSEYKDDEEVKQILHFLFNPYIITGISDKKYKKGLTKNYWYTQDIKNLDFKEEILDYFKVNNTGSDKDVAQLLYFINYTGYAELISGIVKKDLKLGIQATTLNKVFGKGFIPTFSLQLAEKYFDNPEKLLPEGEEFTLTLKMDGVRCILIFDSNNNPQFFTRNGQPISGLIDIEKEAYQLCKDFVYDGELLKINDENMESKDLYRATVKITSSDDIKQDIIFNVFDVIEKDKFQEGASNVPYHARKHCLTNELKTIINTDKFNFIKEVKTLYSGNNQNMINIWLDKIVEEGGEGIMINLNNAPYECKRTKGLLKVKKFNECEAVVIGLEEGTGKNIGKLGAFILEIKNNDKWYSVKCGTGLSDYNREYYWKNQNEVLNKVVEIKYFEKTNNQNNDDISLRFPTWLDRIRFDKDRDSITEV